jgi:hypothetical protein
VDKRTAELLDDEGRKAGVYDKLPHFDVEQVVKARGLFDRLRNEFTEHSYEKSHETAFDCGLAAQACEQASQAIFDAMNTASSYLNHPAAREALDAWLSEGRR